MPNKTFHPSDQELLLAADGELPRRLAAEIRDHLAACWGCRTRMAEIEGTISAFVRAHHQGLDSTLPPIAGSRASLKAQLAERAKQSRHDGGASWRLRFPISARAFAFACALAVLTFFLARLLHRQTIAYEAVARAYAGLLPDRNLTPGATRSVAIDDICSTDHDEVVRTVSGALQQKVFQEYGMRNAPVGNYEVDYLITPGLGGTDDIRNLWPEPRYNTAWNSFVKDQLEDYLHQSVCSRKLSLATAQKDVARDWISAYKKYFHTNEPLPRDSASEPSQTSAFLVNGYPATFDQNLVTSLKWKFRTFIVGTTISKDSSPAARTAGPSISTFASMSMTL
jgi:hypothetical protein